MMLRQEEALGLGLLTARDLGLDGAVPAVEGALAKIQRVMPEAARERVRALEEVVLAGVRPGRLPGGGAVLTLAGAVREEGAAALRSGWSETGRVFDPYGVVRREGYW